MNVNIGPLAFQLAHVLLLACASFAIAVGWLVGRKRQIGISNVMFDMALVAVLTGRVVFVVIWFSAYQDSPWSVFDIRDGGLEMWSALIAAILMAAWRIWQRPMLLPPLVVGVLAGFGAWIVLLAVGWAGKSPPQVVPVIGFMGMDGGLIKLSSQADGQAMVVNMWATWCPSCQQEMPALARAQALHTDVRFVFVNQGESLDVVRRYLRRISFHLDHVLVDEGNLLGKAMDSTALPMTLLYGANGQLVYSHQGLISEAVLAMQLERCCQKHH
jgi:thiol-disulfide isomerase/thioredoxin